VRRLRRWSIGGLLAVAGLIVLDSLCGLSYRTGTEAHVTVTSPRSGTARRAIIILPGYLMAGRLVGQAFAPYVGPDDALVSVDYAQRGVNVADIYARVMDALDKLQPAEVRFYGASMGGMVSLLLADRYEHDGQPFGKPLLILDSAPTQKNDLKRPGFLLGPSCIYRGGPLSTAVWAAASAIGAKPPLDKDADPGLVHAAHHSGAWAGMPAATTQGCFVGRFHPPAKAGRLFSAVVYLETRSAAEDPVVRIPESITHWRAMFPQLTVVALQSRLGRWHLPLVEQPADTAAAIVAVQP
jgi:pimeloyl-ACP methyl ester carboxylesterase